MKKHIKKKWVIVGLVVVVLAAFLSLITFITDILWFKQLGYISVFLKQLVTELEFGIPAFIVIALGCYLYLMGIKKAYYNKIGACEHTEPEKKVNRNAILISAVFGLLVAIGVASKLWFQILQYTNSTDFNILDPIFSRDVSFYIFKLEFLQQLNSILIYIIIGFAAVNIIYYVSLLKLRRPRFMDEMAEHSTAHSADEEGSTRQAGPHPGGLFGQMFEGFFGQKQQGPYSAKPAGAQESYLNRTTLGKLLNIAGLQFKVLVVCFFVMLALFFLLKQFALLYTGSSGVVYGAGFSDINISLWMYRLLMVISVAGAVCAVIGMSQRKIRTILLAPAALIAVFILGNVTTFLVQNLIVEPDELSKESPYLQNNIEFTRYAYDLADISIKDYNVGYTLSQQDIADNIQTISNIRINDYQPALKYYNQTQSIRLYYNFHDVDVDRYMINGEYTQTFLSAREIDEKAITDQWLTKHIKYTHGYGITLSRVDKVTESGQPDMLIDSIPPVSDVKEISFTRPEIYFGENTNNYIIVNTKEQEFDYPSGENNVYTTYEGDGGIPLSFFNRLMFAIREGNIQILVSTNITSDSQILINRNIMTRITTIAPFLSYDSDPYIVVSDDGHLFWILDAYTTSSYYPYSEPYDTGGINYIRNSVKVVVNAYNGDTDFYIVDSDDPIASTLQKIYPALFKDFEAMPESLQAHIRYPNTMFTIQANTYAKYHMTDVAAFYQNEDGWNIANEIYGTEEQPMTPSYYIMELPGESQAEFINSIPYTPSGKFNLTALLVARNDGDAYGDLLLYQMPKDRIIYGPQQVEAQINQHTEIAQDFTLWSSAGSTYTRGNMFVIPISGSLMYVEPIYLESANSSLPEVKRVILYYNERIAYAETLAEALDEMFGEGTGNLLSGGSLPEDSQTQAPDSTEHTGDLDLQQLADKANEAFENALTAQQNGDWAAYGQYIDLLKVYLNRMSPTETANPLDTGAETPVGVDGLAGEPLQ